MILVTNGGEKKLPYSFVVEPDPVGKVLAGLKQSEDFTKLVQVDREFKNACLNTGIFTEAPFLQDLHVRALYDGLKGRPDRQSELEEFLVGLRVKKTVELKADTKARSLENPQTGMGDAIRVGGAAPGGMCALRCMRTEILSICRRRYLRKKILKMVSARSFTA